MKIKPTILALFLLSQLCLFAQVPDTVTVPNQDSQGPRDALTRFILGDTTATGERNNINRVYRLERGQIYFQTGYFYAEGFPLKLIGDGDMTLHPPVIAPFPLSDGSIPRITIYVYEDTHFRNLYFQGVAPTGQRNSADRPIAVMGEGKRFTMNKCIVEGFRAAGVFNGGVNNSFFFNDNKWRNNNWSGVFTGQFFFNTGSGEVPLDTVSIVNNTFFLGSSYFMCTNRQFAKYVRFEHNTLFINHTNPFYAPYLSNADIKNNIFFSPASCGETEAERQQGYYDWDGEHLAVFSINFIPTDMANTYGITDENRRVDLSNNAYFWPQSVLDMLDSKPLVDPPLWLNNRTANFFNDNTLYPNITESNNVEADPGFNSSVLTMVDTLVNYIDVFRTLGSATSYFYNPQGGPIFPARWPVPEDLAYTNTSLLTAADGGFPLGDLNWFPQKKQEWEIWLTDVDDNNLIPEVFNLFQNYPNPFNPETVIKFQLPLNGFVSLKVYDMLGREITTLINNEMHAGNHEVNFNASNLSSGVYFYKLDSGAFSSIKKMMLLK